MVRKIKTAVAMALFMGATLAAEAAGLGKLTVNSSLGQILNAEIDLVSLQPGELDNLSARVASPEAFRDARIEYSSSLRLLRFSIEKRANGQAYLRLSSVAPINEPFVDALIEVTWAAGRVQREYPILLDPPGYNQRAVTPPAGAASPPPVAAAQPATTPPATAPAASSSGAAPSSPPVATVTPGGQPSARAELIGTPSQASGETYGPIQKGETLRKIAEEVKPSNVSLEQMLVALYRENQSAFAGNNMNRLKTGQILKVPSGDQVSQITASDAGKEIRTQVADWRAYREQLAGGVAAIPARAETSTAASGRVTTAAVTPPAPPSAEPKDVLKLSKSDASGKAGAGSAKGGSGAQDRANALQEEITAKDKALRESQSRVSDLEKQIRDMQRLLDLKGGAPATAAKPGDTKVAVAPTPPPPVTPAKVEPAKVEPPKAEPPKVAEVKTTEPSKPTDASKAADASKADASKSTDSSKTTTTTTTTTDASKAGEPPKVADASKPAPPKTDAKAPAKKAPPPPKSTMDELMDNPWIPAAVVGGLAALGIGGFLFMRRRRREDDYGNPSAMTSAFPSDLKPNTNTGKAGGGLVDTGNSSFLTDFDKTGPGTIDTDEVDPVAEAEVYIAYGRDAQAEEILKEAMARDKGRHEIPLKLLEIYHARKSATAFETVAKELRGQVGDGSPLWQKAAAMGAQIDPTNPLYAGAGSGTGTYTAMSTPAPKPDLDVDLGGGTSETTSDATAPAPDFDLDLDAGKAPNTFDGSQTAATAAHTMDFDIAQASGAPTPEAPKEEKPASFDFDLSGLDFPSSKPGGGTDLDVDATKPAPSSSTDFNLADLSLDSGTSDIGGGGEGVGTKLELAKAYLEIGDKDGAREILQEVAKEGSAAQKDEAQRLIASL